MILEALLHAASASVALAMILAYLGGGLSASLAIVALSFGAAVAAWTLWQRRHAGFHWPNLSVWQIGATILFALFAARCFLWLVFFNGDEVRVLSPNNLGDLSLHLTYIRELAGGVRFWPQNPIVTHASLTYPIGVDLLHALLTLAGADVFRIFPWMGLAGAAAAGLALWRWGGAFALAGFLCNGGLAGFLFFQTHAFADFQSDLAWKSIPLALFVTQRGLLFAVPAGLLLLTSWRARFFATASRDGPARTRFEILPFWSECLLYATMPAFHVHTFLFLSAMLLCWFIVRAPARVAIARLVAAAFLPATLLILAETNNLHGPSMLGWLPGWMQSDPDFVADCEANLHVRSPLLTMPIFWLLNFGVLPGAAGLLVFRICRDPRRERDRAIVLPALAVFLLCCFVKFAPWEWDNTKLMFWCYVAILPSLRTRVLQPLTPVARALACFLLFWSGFASLIGGMQGAEDGEKKLGYAIASRTELDEISNAVRPLPVTARFVANPDYNHPLLLLGRSLALGYTGHVHSHGYPWVEPLREVEAILNGDANWRARSAGLGARYLFWGNRESAAFPNSKQPWKTESLLLDSGEWGELYDLQKGASVPPLAHAGRSSR